MKTSTKKKNYENRALQLELYIWDNYLKNHMDSMYRMFYYQIKCWIFSKWAISLLYMFWKPNNLVYDC